MKDILKKSITEHASALEKKEYSSVELVSAYLSRIDSVDGELGAFLYLDSEKAIAAAKEADNRRKLGAPLGKFDGIPIALKDNICTTDMPTTCASKMLEGYRPPYDAFVTEKLKAAGFVILGKTNMDEFGMGSTGENSAFKITKNPANTLYCAGGSSSGSAAAVASFEAPCALGSDTGGSVRLPSAFCGAVGMKPTYGKVSRYGLVAYASSFDQIGPITRTVRDNSSLLGSISAKDIRDHTFSSPYSYNLKENPNDLRGIRIGIPRELLGKEISDEVRASILCAAKRFEELGASVFEVSLPSIKYALATYYIIASAEASSNLARFDSVRYGKRSESATTQDDIYKLSRSEFLGAEVKRRILLGSALLSAGYSEKYYQKALLMRDLIKKDFDDVFSSCDALLSPAAPTTANKLNEKRSNVTAIYAQDLCCVPANIAGIPALTMPCGKDKLGLPIALQLMGASNSENTLYNIAYTFETCVGEI